MKYIFYIIMILSVGLFFSGCEGDQNGKMPDDILEANSGVLIINSANTDPFINLSNPAGYKAEMKVDLLFKGEFNKIDVVVVYNGDYKKQYVITSVTTIPSNVTVTGQQLIDAITELTSADDIMEGDVFNIFTSIELKDGTYLPGFTITGANAITPSVRSQMEILKSGVSNLVINVPCEFILNDYVGIMDTKEFWAPDLYEYQVEIIEDPDYTGSYVGLKILGIWDGTWELKVEVSTYDYSVKGLPASQLMASDLWGYGNPTWSNITGEVSTCTKELIVRIGRFCVTQGCFGGMPIVYTFKKAPDGKKWTVTSRSYEMPQKPFRMVE